MSLIAANARRTPVLQIHPNAPKAHSDTGWSKCSNRPHTQARAHTLGVDNTSKMASARTKSLSRPRVTSDEFQLARERNFLNARTALGQICCGELLLHSSDASDLSAICISDGPGWNSGDISRWNISLAWNKSYMTWLFKVRLRYCGNQVYGNPSSSILNNLILSTYHFISHLSTWPIKVLKPNEKSKSIEITAM